MNGECIICNVTWIIDIFHTRDSDSFRKTTYVFTLLIICKANCQSLKSELLWLILQKLTPCRRNEDLCSLSLLTTILKGWLLLEYFFLKEKKELNFLTDTGFLRAAI